MIENAIETPERRAAMRRWRPMTSRNCRSPGGEWGIVVGALALPELRDTGGRLEGR